MAKRNRTETEEERRERKKAKKEAKKVKTLATSTPPPARLAEKELHDSNPDVVNNEPPAPIILNKEPPIAGSKHSCQRKTVQMIFSLYPSDLEDIVKEIKRSLRSKLLRYIAGMEGVLLAFDNIRILPNGGRIAGIIINEQPQIHYIVELDTLVFAPSENMRLLGTVTECFESHVGLLVHNYFNASIASDHLVSAGYYFEDGCWVKEDGSAMTADEIVNFTVERIHESAGTISMEGVDPSVSYSF